MSTTRSVPTSPKSSVPATPVDQRKAKRDLLRDFYGLKGVAASPRGQNSDPLDIDSASFNAPQYYQHLVATASLPQLLEKATSLSNEINDLNSSRHSLVYNHHHQLFSAGDTIAHLNRRTPELLSILAELQNTFSDIERLAESVALPPERAGDAGRVERERLRGLEGTLRLMREAGDSDELIKETLDRDRPVLETWAQQGVKGAQSLLDKCEAVLSEPRN